MAVPTPNELIESTRPVTGRDIAALQDPRPVCIIGACGLREQPLDAVATTAAATDADVTNAAEDALECGFATVIWVTPVSHDPAMLVFALREKSRTMELLRASNACSVSLLPADASGIALTEICGGKSGHRVNKGELVPHAIVNMNGELLTCATDTPDGAPCMGCQPVPVPTQAVSWATCQVTDVRPAGDHLLVTCDVISAHSAEARDEKGRIAPENTLLCVQHGAYGTVSLVSE